MSRSERLNIEKLQEHLNGSLSKNPGVLIYSCLDDKFQGNIKYLEDNQCNVGRLKALLKDYIDDENETAALMGYAESGGIITDELRTILQFIEKRAIAEGGQTPMFEEIIEFILKENASNPEMFIEIVMSLRSSGYNTKVVVQNSKYKTLNKHCDDLVIKAKNNRLDPLIGREGEVERMIEILAHYKKKNPLLVGPAGVGKT